MTQVRRRCWRFPELRMLGSTAPDRRRRVAVIPGAKLAELYVSSTKIGDTGAQILDHLPHLVALGSRHHDDRQRDDRADREASRAAHARAGEDPHRQARAARQLHALEQLFLDDTWLGDAGARDLAGLPNCACSMSRQTNVSDESFGCCAASRGSRSYAWRTPGHRRRARDRMAAAAHTVAAGPPDPRCDLSRRSPATPRWSRSI